MSSMYFHYVAIIYPWKNARQFIWPLNYLKQRILCVKFGWNCPRGFWEKDFKGCQLQKKFTLSLLSLHKKGQGRSFERNWIPFAQGCFVPSSVEIVPRVSEEEVVNVFFIMSLLSLVDRDPSFELSWIVFTYVCFMSTVVEIDSAIREKLMYENINLDGHLNRQTENKLQMFCKVHLGFQLRLASTCYTL